MSLIAQPWCHGSVMPALCTHPSMKCHQKCFEGERGGGGTVSWRGERIQEKTEVDRAGDGAEKRDRNREGGGMCKGR